MDNKNVDAPERAAQIEWDLLTTEDDGRICKDIPKAPAMTSPKTLLLISLLWRLPSWPPYDYMSTRVT